MEKKADTNELWCVISFTWNSKHTKLIYGYSNKSFSCPSEVDIDKKGTQGNRNVLCFECGVGYTGIYTLSKFIRLNT